jgi:hypothetical protein
MSLGLKGSSSTPLPGGDTAFRSENAKSLLGICLKSVHDLSRRYFYSISGEESIPGTLSYLLSIKEADLIEIFKICGFYGFYRGRHAFQRSHAAQATDNRPSISKESDKCRMKIWNGDVLLSVTSSSEM